VRTTLTIDDDVAALLKKENRRAQEPMKQTINRALRSGLAHASKPTNPGKFVVKPIHGMKLPPEWTSGNVQELIERLEGPNAR
jgi:hypothetical protein